jgi:CheY-like chemotaxis protein
MAGVMAHLLVIDDKDGVLSCLSELGYKVKEAQDGREGVELFYNGYNFDLVVTEIDMPRMHGNTVAKYIRRSTKPKTPIVAIAGPGDNTNKELFDFVLMRPFPLKTLHKVIKLLT